MIGPAGISLAASAGPLDDPVTWSRIDNIAGVSVESITIDRGRPDERSKTTPGSVTIRGIDTKGVLDPTNLTSPLFPNVALEKQMAISLYNPITTQWNWLFRGNLSSIEHELHVSERWSTFTLTLVDWLQFLNDAEVVPDAAGNAVPYESKGDCYYDGQHCDDRIFAVLSDAATAFEGQTWPVGLLQVASGNVFVQGRAYAAKTPLMSVIDEACDAEYPVGTNRYQTKDGAFGFRGRFYRFAPANYLASSDAARAPNHEMVHWNVGDLTAAEGDNTIALISGMTFKESDENLINAVLVTPVGITTEQLATNSENTFQADATSVVANGVRTGGMSFEGLITSDADDHNTFLQECASFAEAIVGNYANPITFADTLTFRNPPPGATADQIAALWDLLCGTELSDLVTVNTYHPGGGGFNPTTGVEQDHFLEAIHYDITALQGDEWNVTLKLTLSSRQHYRFMPASWSILAGPPPGTQAAFTFHSDSSDPLTFDFVDESTGAVLWDWDWGDGTTHGSTFLGVTHTYATAGTYTVTLTITDLSSATSTVSHTLVA